jgi:hypothetical protein
LDKRRGNRGGSGESWDIFYLVVFQGTINKNWAVKQDALNERKLFVFIALKLARA